MDLMVQGFLGAMAPEVDSDVEDDPNQGPFGTWRPGRDDGNNRETADRRDDSDKRRRSRSQSRPRPRRTGEGGSPKGSERKGQENRQKQRRNTSDNPRHGQPKQHGKAVADKELDFKKKMEMMSKKMNSKQKEQREAFEAEKKELMKKIDKGREANKALQKKVDELSFYRDLDSNDVSSMKDKVKDFERKIQETELKCEQEKEDIRDSFNSKMDILVKQLQKVQKRHDDLMQSSSSNVQEKEAAMKTMEQTHSETILGKEEEVATCKAKIQELIDSLAEEKERVNGAQKKHQQELFDLKEKHEKDLDVLRRRHLRDMDQLKEAHEKEMRGLRDKMAAQKEELEQKAEKIQTKLELTQVTLYDTEMKLKMMKTGNDETLASKKGEIASLGARLHATEKTVMNYRGRAKSEMDSLKDVVGKSNASYDDRINQASKEKNSVHQELKDTKTALAKLEKQMEHTLEAQSRKTDALKRRDDELSILKNELSEANKLHQKAIKEKDISHIKEKKKWDATHQKLREEISDLQACLTSLNCKDAGDLKGVVAQLKAEKSTLLMKLVSVEEKYNSRITSLEEELESKKSSPDYVEPKKLPTSLNSMPSSRSLASTKTTDSGMSRRVRSRSPSPVRRIISTSDDKSLSSEKNTEETLTEPSTPRRRARSLSRKGKQIFDKRFSKD